MMWGNGRIPITLQWIKLLQLCYCLSKIPIIIIDPSLLHRNFRIILSGTANDTFLNVFNSTYIKPVHQVKENYCLHSVFKT